MRALGATDEQIKKANIKATKNEFAVWEENWETLQMFLRMQTQWRIGFSGPTGLDYAALEWLCKLYPVEDPAFLFEGLQLMEAAALTTFNNKKS